MSEATLPAPKVVEGTATEMVPVEAQPTTTLFRTDDPEEVVERSSKAAAALKRVLVDQKLTVRIQGREHVLVEGWQTLGAMLGVTSVCTWTRKTGDEKTGGWEARVEARTLDGRVIGAAEAECLRDEKTWHSRDDYALRSMAQTRATSKALRSVLAFVVTLAGYDPTPAEEMPGNPPRERKTQPVKRPTASKAKATEAVATVAQRKKIFARAKGMNMTHDDVKNLLTNVAGTPHTDRLPKAKVDDVLQAIEGWPPDA